MLGVILVLSALRAYAGPIPFLVVQILLDLRDSMWLSSDLCRLLNTRCALPAMTILLVSDMPASCSCDISVHKSAILITLPCHRYTRAESIIAHPGNSWSAIFCH